MSKEDLKPITTTEQAKRLGRIGGSRSTIPKQLCKIKWCTTKCPIYSKCRYSILSKKYPNENNKKYYCALKKADDRIRNRYLNLLLGGEQDLIDEGINLLLGIKDDYKALSGVEKIHKMRFGTKVLNENKDVSFIDSLRTAAKELKVIGGEIVNEDEKDENKK